MAKKSTSGSIDLGSFGKDLYNDLAKMLGAEEQSLKGNTQEQKNNSKARSNNAEMIEKMNQLMSQQAELTKKMNDFFDIQTKKIKEGTKAIKEQTAALEEKNKQATSGLTGTKKYSNDNRKVTVGFDLQDEDLVKTSATLNKDVKEQYIKNSIADIKVLNGEVQEVILKWKKVNEEIEKADKIQKQLAEELAKRNIKNEDSEEWKKLTSEVENYKKAIKDIQDKSKNGITSLSTDFDKFTESTKSFNEAMNTAAAKAEELGNTKTTFDDVINQLKEIDGLNFDSFEKLSASGNVTKYRDELGRVLTITKQIDSAGQESFSYKLTDRFGKLADETDRVYSSVNRLDKGLDKLKNTSETRLAADLKSQIDEVYQSMQNLEVEITKAQRAGDSKKVNQLTKEYGKQSKELKVLAEEYKEVNAQIRNQGGWMLNLKDSWTKAMRSFTTYISVTTVFYQAARAIRSMINEVKELDESLTEFKKVSDLSGDSLEKYIKQAYEMGETVAKTGREMIEAATEFRKSGFNDQDALKLGQIANLYTNIADESLSAGDAASFIIAQMKAFKIEAKDAIRIVDALNEVSNNYAVSSAELATAIGKVSSTMAAGDTTYEQTLGMLTAITEITRNSSKAANALKTIGQRIRGVGEDGEDASEYVASLQGQFDKLGINAKIVKNSAGEMESTYNILKAMAEKWNDLSDAERQSIGELAAGKNRITEFNALMSNWSTAVDATTTAMESNGSASRENERVLDSIQGHIQRLNSEWEKLSQNLVQSSWIKSVVDIGAGILKLLNSGIGQLIIKMGATTVVTKTATSALMKYIIQQKIQNAETKKMTNEQNGLIASFKALGQYISILTGKTKLDSNAKKAQITVNKTLAASQFALNAVMGAASLVITLAVSAWEKYKREQQEAIDKTLEYANSIESIKGEQESLVASFKEYRETLGNVNSTVEEKKAATKGLRDIEEKLNSVYEYQEKKLDLVNGKYEEQLKLINELSAKEADKLFTKSSDVITEAKDKYYGGKVGQINILGKDTDWLGRQKYATDLFEAFANMNDYDVSKSTINAMGIGGGSSGIVSNMDIEQTLEYLNKFHEYLEENKSQLIQNGMEEKIFNNTLELTSERIRDLEEDYGDYINVLKNARAALWQTTEGQEAMYDFIEAGKDGLTDEEIDKLLEKYPTLKTRIDTVGLSYDDLRDKFDAIKKSEEGLDEATEKTSKTLSNTTKGLKDLMDEFSNLQNSYNAVRAAMDEFNETGELSIDTMSSLMDSGAWQYLDYVNGKIQVNNKALKTQETILKANMLATLQKSFADDALALSEGNIDKMTAGAKAAINEQKSTNEQAGNIAAAAAGKFFVLADAQKAIGDSDYDFEANKGKFQKLVNYYNSVAKSIGNLKIKTTSGTGSGGNGKTKWETELEKINNQYKNSEITIEKYIEKLEKLRKKYKKNKTAVKELDDAIRQAKLEKLEDDYKRGLISVEKYIKGLKELQKQYKKNTKEWNNYADKIKKGLEDLLKNKNNDFKTAQQAAIDLLEDEIDEVDKLKEETEKYYDDLIAAKEKANDETERELELARLQEALENARNNKNKRVYVQGLGWQWMADEEAIADAQKALDDFNNEQEIADLEAQKEEAVKALEEQISSLEEYKDQWQQIADEYEKEQNRIILAAQLGAYTEEDILNQRIDVLEDFKNRYLAILRDIDKVDNATADDISNGKVDLETVDGYAEGGVIDYTGLAKLHGSANKPEIVLNNAQAANLYSMLKRPQTSPIKFSGGGSTQVYNFDNLVLPNVSNARQFLNELRTITNINKNL